MRHGWRVSQVWLSTRVIAETATIAASKTMPLTAAGAPPRPGRLCPGLAADIRLASEVATAARRVCPSTIAGGQRGPDQRKDSQRRPRARRRPGLDLPLRPAEGQPAKGRNHQPRGQNVPNRLDPEVMNGEKDEQPAMAEGNPANSAVTVSFLLIASVQPGRVAARRRWIILGLGGDGQPAAQIWAYRGRIVVFHSSIRFHGIGGRSACLSVHHAAVPRSKSL